MRTDELVSIVQIQMAYKPLKSLLFQPKFGIDPSDFKTIDDINKFYEDRTGNKLTYDHHIGD